MAAITISPDFRTIQVPTGLILAVEGDQNVLTVNFTMARYYNGIDLSEYALKINYINAGGCGDIYLITEPEIQEEQILFNWTIGQNAAAYRGRLTFALEATKTDEAGTVTNELHTMPASIRVPATVDVCTGAAETALSDLLAQLMKIAGEAQQSATEAAQSATQAARSEEQAGEYADRAEASAYNAGLAKEQAQAARTGSEAAQTAAESARTAASNSSTRAANSATAAAGSAQEAADSRTEAAAYINELAGEKMNGDTVSYTAEAALPIEDLTIDIQGSQDLNGYRSPWVGGAGKNKLPAPADETRTLNGITVSVKNGVYTVSGTSTAYTTFLFELDKAYTFPSSDDTNILFLNTFASAQAQIGFALNNTNVNIWATVPANRVINSWVKADNATFNQIKLNIAQGQTINGTFAPMFILKTATDTSFEPYENIAPITAYTGRTITQQGKNLCESIVVPTGQNRFSTAFYAKAELKPNTYYAISFEGVAGNSYYLNENVFIMKVINVIEGRNTIVGLTRPTLDKTAANQYNANNGWLVMKNNIAEPAPNVFSNMQIEEVTSYADTATEYEPYQHAETAVSWETEAGEVYKGRLNVSTGVLTVERITWSPDTARGIASYGDNKRCTIAYPTGKAPKYTGATSFGLSDSFITAYVGTVANADSATTIVGFPHSREYIITMPPFTNINTLADMTAWLQEHKPKIAYELAEPITYQLTPQEVRNLIGRQTLSSNTGAIVNALIRTGEETWIDARLESIKARIEALHS